MMEQGQRVSKILVPNGISKFIVKLHDGKKHIYKTSIGI